jgi:DNA-binding PadR family transcriptional regulator
VTGPAEPAVPTLAFALLALLAREPLTGYEMSRQLRDPIGLFWQARHSQVYSMLSRLEALGWTTSEAFAGPGPRPTRRYAITDDGMAGLRAWVGSGSARRGGRDQLLLRVYASWVADRSATVAFLREAEARHAEQLRVYLDRRARADARGVGEAPGTADFADYATLRRGIGHERGRLAWVRWLIRKVEAGD